GEQGPDQQGAVFRAPRSAQGRPDRPSAVHDAGPGAGRRAADRLVRAARPGRRGKAGRPPRVRRRRPGRRRRPADGRHGRQDPGRGRRTADHPVAGADDGQPPRLDWHQGLPGGVDHARAADELPAGRHHHPEPGDGGADRRERRLGRGPPQRHLHAARRRDLERRRAVHRRRRGLHLAVGNQPGQRRDLGRDLRRDHRDGGGRPVDRPGHLCQPERQLVRVAHRHHLGLRLPQACARRRRPQGGPRRLPPEAGRDRSVRGRVLLGQRPDRLHGQPELPRAEQALFRHRQPEGRRRRPLGRPRRPPDRRLRLRLEPPGGAADPGRTGSRRTGEPAGGAGHQRRADRDPARRPERGGRRPARRDEHPAPVPDRPRRPPGDQPGGPARRHLATALRRGGGAGDGQHPGRDSGPCLTQYVVGVQRREGAADPRGRRLDGAGRCPRQGRRRAADDLLDLDQLRPPKGAGDRQAGAGADRLQGRAAAGRFRHLLRRLAGQRAEHQPLLQRHPDVHQQRLNAVPGHLHARLVRRAGRREHRPAVERLERPEQQPLPERRLRRALRAGPRGDRPRDRGRDVHPAQRHPHRGCRGRADRQPGGRQVRRLEHAGQRQRGDGALREQLLERRQLEPDGGI
ncbi:MAG: ABC transporter, substrate-binding protein (cluster 5, nickel/peptides/opines), partial [uncultured Thermomicrobiales bacterium]